MIKWLHILVCKLTHSKHHRLHQIEYGGGYLCSCELCKCVFYVNR